MAPIIEYYTLTDIPCCASQLQMAHRCSAQTDPDNGSHYMCLMDNALLIMYHLSGMSSYLPVLIGMLSIFLGLHSKGMGDSLL